MRVDRSRLPDVGADPPFRFPRMVRHTLRNGLKVRTVEHHTVPVLTTVILVDGGVGADPPGHDGLAAITADMVDEGTGALTAIEVSEALAQIGAEYDVDVGSDATVFTLTTLDRFAERGAALLADLLIRPSMRLEDFDRVRQLRLDRLKQLKDLPPAVAERAFLRLMYGDHPYGHLAIGTEASLKELTVERCTGFHSEMFRPERATMVIVGARTHDELLAVGENAFGGWEQTGSPETPPLAVPDVTGSGNGHRLTVVPREGAAQSELRIGHLSAHRTSPDYPSLLVMNAVLGGQFVSRINLKLREEKGFTYGARTGFDWRRQLSPFSLQASVHTASTAEAIRDALTEIEGIRGSRPPSDEEMTLARASLTRGYPRNFETTQQVARSVAQLALYGLPDSYFEEFIPKVKGVTADDVVRAAQRYVDPNRASTLIVGDHSVIAESLASLGLGEPQLLPAS
jgi:predicted Zn-dependent peptidase